MKEDTIYLTYADIAARTGIPEATLRVRRHRGQMPPPDYQPNPRVALWLPSTIEQWTKRGHDEASAANDSV